MARDYASLIKQLLPRGKVWNRFAPVANQLWTALAAEFSRVDQRVQDMLLEQDPRTVTETIADWERNWGLPDPCAPAPTTLADRRAALAARVISRGGWSGGPSEPFFRSLITALGYLDADIEIRMHRFQPFAMGSAMGDALYTSDEGWPYVWEFDVRHGSLDAVLACQVSKKAPAANALLFAFPLAFFEDGTFSRSGTTAVLVNPSNNAITTLTADEMGEFRIGV